MLYAFIVVLSLLLRFVYGYYSHYTEDEARLWQLGMQVVHTHRLPNHGMPIVYSSSLLPGSFQSLLAACPLFISQHPFSLILFLQLWNAISQCILYLALTRLFPRFKSAAVFACFLFAPWSILFSYAWNPSFLPLFFSLFFWGMVFLWQTQEEAVRPYKNGQRLFAYFCVFSPFLLTLQLNLQVLPLIPCVALFVVRGLLPARPLAVLAVTQLPGLYFLAPWFFAHYKGVPLDNPTWGYDHALAQNIQFHLSHLIDTPHQLLRLLSLTTADVWNRFEQGFLHRYPIVFPVAFLCEAASFILIAIAASFFVSRRRWVSIWRLFTKGACNQRDLASLQSGLSRSQVLQRVDAFCTLAPLMLIAASLFSITTLAVHSLLCLIFVPYYILFRRLDELGLSLFKSPLFVGTYIVFTSTYAVIAGVSFRSTFHDVWVVASVECKNPAASVEQSLLPKNEVWSQEIHHTAHLLCDFFIPSK